MKKIINHLWKGFVFNSHLSSLGAGAGIIFSSLFILEKDFNLFLLASGYLALQIIYNYDHLIDLGKDSDTNLERSEHLKKKKEKGNLMLIIYSIVLVLVSLIINLQTFLFFFIFTIGGLLYTLKFKKITKKIFLFKNIYVSFFVSLLPLSVIFSSSFKNLTPLFLITCFVFLRLLLNTIYFDLKDIQEDRQEGLKTLPVIFGEQKTINFLYIFNILTFIPIFVGVLLRLLPTFSLSLLLLLIYSWYYLKKSKQKQQKKIRLLSYIMADGEYILWPVILMIAKILLK